MCLVCAVSWASPVCSISLTASTAVCAVPVVADVSLLLLEVFLLLIDDGDAVAVCIACHFDTAAFLPMLPLLDRCRV